MMAWVAQELRDRFSDEHQDLEVRAWMTARWCVSRAWWCDDAASVDCWWLVGAAPHCGARRFIESSKGDEVLALLRALAQVDLAKCAAEIESVWRHYLAIPSRPAHEPRPRVPAYCEIGFEYTIFTADDLASIRERLHGAWRPSESFMNTYEWLYHEVLSVDDSSTRLHARSIPVRIRIELKGIDRASDTGDALAQVLSEIVAIVTAQRSQSRLETDAEAAHIQAAASSARFEIVEVDVPERTGALVNVEALELLVTLQQLGIRVIRLPPIRYISFEAQERLSITKSLVPLLMLVGPSRSPPTTHVFVSDDEGGLSTIFSAIQASDTITRVRLKSIVGLSNENDEFEEPELLWRWAAYALFSRHASRSVDRVVLSANELSTYALQDIEHVLHAENPLAALFDATGEHDRWVSASRFLTNNPEHDAPEEGHSLVLSQKPLYVRVIDSTLSGSIKWWRVLLPCVGEAWVHADEAIEITRDDAGSISTTDGRRPRDRPLRLKFKQFKLSSSDRVLTFLRLLRLEDIGGIEIKQEYRRDQHLDQQVIEMTDWTLKVLRLLPKLEWLKYSAHAQIECLGTIVDAAHVGICHLRTLSLGQRFNPDTSDVIEFLDVLSDPLHPLTKRLQELHLEVCIPRDVTRTKDFGTAWRRMLQRNRTLHTISLLLIAEDSLEPPMEAVAVRGSPLCMTSKLAFLSTIHEQSSGSSGRSQLGADVVAAIFEYAAELRVRTISVKFMENDALADLHNAFADVRRARTE